MSTYNNKLAYIFYFLILLMASYILITYFKESNTPVSEEEEIESYGKPLSEPSGKNEKPVENEDVEAPGDTSLPKAEPIEISEKPASAAPTEKQAEPVESKEAEAAAAFSRKEGPTVLTEAPASKSLEKRRGSSGSKDMEASDTSSPNEEQIDLSAEEPLESEAAEAPEENGPENYREMADDFHQMISERLVTSANWLDSFFRDERSEIEENTTSLRLRLSSFLEENEGLNADVRLRLRLVLPELEDKFHILITGDRDEDKDFREEPMGNRGEIDEDSERNVNLALQYFIRTAEDNNVSFTIGGRVNGLPPVLYAGPRFRISKKFDPWLFRFTQGIRYFSDDGWESRTSFDFDKSLTERLFFRTSIDGQWFEHEDGYYYDVGFILYQVLDENRALEYSWNNLFETRPSHQLNQVLLRVEYRQRFWRKWLFFEIKPQFAFREEDDYKSTPGITFAVEALFGEKGK